MASDDKHLERLRAMAATKNYLPRDEAAINWAVAEIERLRELVDGFWPYANRRRGELIDMDIAFVITRKERAELDRLNALADANVERFPKPEPPQLKESNDG